MFRRIDVGDVVVLNDIGNDAIIKMLNKNLRGEIAEVVDGRSIDDVWVVSLDFDRRKIRIDSVPVQYVQHVGLA